MSRLRSDTAPETEPYLAIVDGRDVAHKVTAHNSVGDKSYYFATDCSLYEGPASSPEPTVPAAQDAETPTVQSILNSPAQRDLCKKSLRFIMDAMNESPAWKIIGRTEYSRETDGRWICDFIDHPGIMAYGQTKREAFG